MATKDQSKDQKTAAPRVEDAPGERVPVGRVKIREDDELADEHSGFFDPERIVHSDYGTRVPPGAGVRSKRVSSRFTDRAIRSESGQTSRKTHATLRSTFSFSVDSPSARPLPGTARSL